MLTSRTGHNKITRRANKQAGFTLIEVMVVLLIIGLMVGAVALSLPARPDPLSIQGKAMESSFRAFAQSSMVDRQAKGIRLTKSGYEFMTYQNGDWQLVAEYDYNLDTMPNVRLMRNGANINLDVARKNEMPMLQFGSTGLATPFRVVLEDGQSTAVIIGSVTGDITYEAAPK